MNEINFNIKTYDIFLTEKVQKQKDRIENLILNISKKIHNNQINDELNGKLKLLTSNTSTLYSVVMGDVQLAEITKNLINYLGPKRSLNNELHLNLNKIENLYLEGKYAISLNLIIDELSKII
jgi:two-component sensor histidine kinase